MSQFSTNETVSLEKRIDALSNIQKTNRELLNDVYEVDKCTKWVLENGYKKVCLQFPDYLLPDSAELVAILEAKLHQKMYILGDTAYESCCIDYTAARHISADAILHFGQTCFSKSENLIPCLKIFEKFDLNLEEFIKSVKNKFQGVENDLILLVNTPYLYKLAQIKTELNQFQIFSIEDDFDLERQTVLYLGGNDRKLMNINLSYSPKLLHFYDPKIGNEIQLYDQDTKILKRRYFLIETIKDSSTMGIVINTLAVKNYLKIIERIKTLAKLYNKKYYIISVGKPTVAKLANFPEVDIFVVVGCAMNEIYENRDFYKPIVTPFDIESALNPKLENTFTYDFNKFLTENNQIDEAFINELKSSDVSLLTGQIRYRKDPAEAEVDPELASAQISVRSKGVVQLNDTHGAGYLATRSWQGLEQNLGSVEPHLATQGRKGLAQTYENEHL